MKKKIICLLGPTACGKTHLALEMVDKFPCEIISVDSAMIYRGMDIGTAKPSVDVLKKAPHHLINIRNPSEFYSVGEFRKDALQAIEKIMARNKIPLLVGGTMMYFRVLQQGLAALPSAHSSLRKELEAHVAQEGKASLYAWLARVDTEAAKRINPHDIQRIQRALEVYLLTGKTISAWQVENTQPLSDYCVHYLALSLEGRAVLHERIKQRFQMMLRQGLVEEVEQLFKRGDLNPNMPSMRSVNYRQIWEYLSGLSSYEDMQEKCLAATRQLAKRQMTWLRSWPGLVSLYKNYSYNSVILQDLFIESDRY